MIRVLLVEDHRTLAEALELALRASGDIEVVGCATTIADAQRLIASTRPQVVLADHHLPDGDVGRLAATLASVEPRLALVILTADSSDAAMATAVEIGAAGHLLKTAGLEEIARAVRRAAEGELVLPRTVLLAALRHRTLARRRESVSLTERERQVLALMAEGVDSQGMADRLGVTLHTARDHAQAVLEKLDARSRLQAVARAYELGLLGPPGRAPPPALAG